MGQYYLPINVDNYEYLYSHDYDNGLKLMEHSYVGNMFMNVIERLLSPEGPWHKTRLVWAGDYAQGREFLPKIEQAFLLEDSDDTLYQYVHDNGLKINPEISPLASKRATPLSMDLIPKSEDLLYVHNHTKKMYVDLTECPVEPYSSEDYSYKIHPLSLLCSLGNGNGGGDYYKSAGSQYIGTWAGDSISMERSIQDGYTLLTPGFTEA